MSTGILLINLGTPSSPSTKDVRSFLAEFLCDPFVIDLPAVMRYLIVYGLVLPFRPKKSAEAYKKVWTKEGSPIAVNSKKLCDELSQKMGDGYNIVHAMRYGRPNIYDRLASIQHCDNIIALPLFPQYSLAATETCLQQIDIAANKLNIKHKTRTIKDFFLQPAFINAQANIIKEFLEKNPETQKLVLSFHGLPVRQIKKVEKNRTPCAKGVVCPAINANNRYCYRAQCYASAAAIAKQLPEQYRDYRVSFQSRLGKNPWIEPATSETLRQLRQQNITRVAVACPSFVADCLETLEEIAIQAKEEWCGLGGDDLQLIPCLNAHPYWVEQLAAWLSGIADVTKSSKTTVSRHSSQ